MFKKLSLVFGAIVALANSLAGQIANFIELSDAENPVSDITDDLNVHIADLDDDGFDEVIMYPNDMSSVRYFDNDGTGVLTELDPASNPLTAIAFMGSLETGDTKRMEFADFDNDGDTDVAVFSQKYYNDGTTLFFANDGNQVYTEVADLLELQQVSNGQFTDIDGDGDVDCVTTNFVYDGDTKLWNAYNQVAIFDEVAGEFEPFSDFAALEGDQLNFIDINEDGDDDSFFDLAGTISWQEKTMPNTFSTPEDSPVTQMQLATSAFRFDVGDINNDGALEMIVFDPVIPKMRFYEQCLLVEGSACDDGDDCTENDAIDENCECVGTALPDTDMDGLCDAIDDTNGDCTLGASCDDGDECTENDVFDSDCNCTGTPLPDSDMDGLCDAIDDTNGDCTLGEACDDGDECTINDALDSDCNCVGETTPDSDMDGICDAIDDTNGDCTLGDACDDGDICTINDALDSDCNCVGEAAPDMDMDGLCDAIDDTNGDCTLGASCDDGDECTENDVFDSDCNCAGTPLPDSDMDGICDAIDDTNGDCTLGASCDDGDDCTINDAFDSDCNCVGEESPDSDMDGICDAIDETNGDCSLGGPCDDGDVCTINDSFDADCQCVGEPGPDSDMDGICDEIDETNGDCTLGGPCDDGDVCTINDAFDADCQCIGEPGPDSDMDGLCDEIDETNGDCVLGDPCDDGDDCTIDDALDADCQCVGIFQDSDNDTVCDAEDVCPGEDDTIDENMDGIPDCIVGIEEILKQQMSIFPNPSNGFVNIETDLLIQLVEVYSSQGREIGSMDLVRNQLDFRDYPSGLYILRINTELGVYNTRLVIQ